MELVCFQGDDSGSLPQIKALIDSGDWNKIIIVRNKNSEKFDLEKDIEIVEVDSTKNLTSLKKDIMDKVKDKLHGSLETALSIASGNGKEHIALISALLSLPVGIKLVAYTSKGVEFIH